MKIKNKKIFYYKLLETLAFTATIGGFLLAFFSLNNIKNIYIFLILIGFLIMNVVIAYIRSFSKSKLTLNITEKIKINIFFEDLFASPNNIIIPVNEYFDTLVDNEVISSKTVHGMFINKFYGANVSKLDEQINEKLDGLEYIEKVDRKRGKNIRYELGTTIYIEEKGKKFFLVALSKFSDKNKAYLSNNEYQRVIHSLLNYLHDNSQGERVNIPLIGAGQSGVKLSKQNLLEYLLFSIKLHDDLTLSGDMNIILHRSIKDKIDLNKIEYIYKLGGF